MDADLDAVVAAELRLLDPAVRRDPDAALALLHADFREFGASGTVWDRESIRQVFGPGSDDELRAEDLRPVRLGPDAVLLTYTVWHGEAASRRTSVWVRTGEGWRLLHHQGTRVP